MIIRFTPHQTTILPNWMFSQNLIFKSSLMPISQCGILFKYDCPPTSSDDLYLLFCISAWYISLFPFLFIFLACSLGSRGSRSGREQGRRIPTCCNSGSGWPRRIHCSKEKTPLEIFLSFHRFAYGFPRCHDNRKNRTTIRNIFWKPYFY